MLLLSQKKKKMTIQLILTWLLVGFCHAFTIQRIAWTPHNFKTKNPGASSQITTTTTTTRTTSTTTTTATALSQKKKKMIALQMSFLNTNPSSKKPKDFKDVLQRLKLVIVRGASQFTPAYVTGYTLSIIWGIISSRETNPLSWGMDFGIISAYFRASQEVFAQFFFPAGNGEEGPWKEVVRNALLGAYVSRGNGWFGMIRSSILYGICSYYLVKQQKKMMKKFMGGGLGGGLGGMGGLGGLGGLGGGGGNAADMQELLKQMSGGMNAQQSNIFTFANMAGGGGSAPAGTMSMEDLLKQQMGGGGGTTPSSSSATGTTKSPSKTKNKKPKREPVVDAMDVEWEPIDKKNTNTDNGDNERERNNNIE